MRGVQAVLISVIAIVPSAYPGKKLAGVYTGTWSGASGTAGDFRYHAHTDQRKAGARGCTSASRK